MAGLTPAPQGAATLLILRGSAMAERCLWHGQTRAVFAPPTVNPPRSLDTNPNHTSRPAITDHQDLR